MIRRMIAAATAVLLGVALTGCSANDSLAQQYQEGNEKGYIAGDFRVVEIAAGERGDPVVFEGVTETGETVSSDDYRGEVLVVNFWYAACGPCIVEAPLLEEVGKLSRENQHEACVLANKFRNLHLYGCWWYVPVSSVFSMFTPLCSA